MTSDEKEQLREITQGHVMDGMLRLRHARNIAGSKADNDILNNMDIAIAAFTQAELKIKRLLGV